MGDIKRYDKITSPYSFREDPKFRDIININTHAKYIYAEQKNQNAQFKSIETWANTRFNNYFEVYKVCRLDPVELFTEYTRYYQEEKEWIWNYKKTSNKYTEVLSYIHQLFITPDFNPIKELYYTDNTSEEKKKYTFKTKR